MEEKQNEVTLENWEHTYWGSQGMHDKECWYGANYSGTPNKCTCNKKQRMNFIQHLLDLKGKEARRKVVNSILDDVDESLEEDKEYLLSHFKPIIEHHKM